MNTACQIKKHTNKSASRKSDHILRHGDLEAYIIIIKHTENVFASNNKKLPCTEKNIIKKITGIKNKINVYTKRLSEYINRGDVPTKRLEKIEKQIKDLKKELQSLQKYDIHETRGKKRSKNYFELELSLTNSNKYKKEESFQTAVNNAVVNMLFRAELESLRTDMTLLTQVMHLDQFSLHEHLLFKLNDNQTIDSILKNLTHTKDGRDGVGLINDIFHEEMEKELSKLGFELEEQERGKKYLALDDYKKSTNFANFDDESPIYSDFEEDNSQCEFQKEDENIVANLEDHQNDELQNLQQDNIIKPKKTRKQR